MSKRTAKCAEDVINRGGVRAIDVDRLRECIAPGTPPTAEDAEWLFSIEDACPGRDAAWTEFYIGAISDYAVSGHDPAGYVTQGKAQGLMARLTANCQPLTRTGVELLVTVIEKARWSPASLAGFALAEVARAAVRGAGPLRAGTGLAPGRIAGIEIDLLGRMMRAFGGDSRLPITRPEAETLFSIDAAMAGTQPGDAWTDLFVKAITNALLASSDYAVPTRRDALRQATWPGLWGVVWPDADSSQKAAWSFERIAEKYRKQSPEDRALARLERQRFEIITNEEIVLADVGWISERLGRKRPGAGAKALLDRLSEARLDLHPLLHDLVVPRARAA